MTIGSFSWVLIPMGGDQYELRCTTPALGPNYNSGSVSTADNILALFPIGADGRAASFVVRDRHSEVLFDRVGSEDEQREGR